MSVVIPAFNRAKTLSRSVASVLAQTERDFEVIVVDDGSTDRTFSLVSKLSDPRIKLERHNSNRGAAAARNTGVKAAKGEWIAFLDSDDEWLPRKLELQLTHLSKTPSKIRGVCCGIYLREKGEGTLKRLIPTKNSYWHKYLLLGCNLGPGTTLMVAREAFEHIGYLDETFQRFEDWEWLLRFTKHFQLESVTEPLVIVNRERHTGAQVVEQSALRIISLYSKEAREYGLFFERKFRARRWLHLAWLYLEEGNLPKGFKYLIKAMWYDPAPPPGMILLVLDTIFGTSMAREACAWRRRLDSGPYGAGATTYARLR